MRVSFKISDLRNVSCPLLQAAAEPEPLQVAETPQPCVPVLPKPQKMEEPALPCALIQSMGLDMTAADEEFVPGSMCKCAAGSVS